ncbi:unnamed protein product, partial [Prorocentrum cordatum]
REGERGRGGAAGSPGCRQQEGARRSRRSSGCSTRSTLGGAGWTSPLSPSAAHGETESPPELRRSAAQPRSGLRQQAPAGPVGPRGRQAPSEPGFPREPPRPPRRWQLLGDGARRLEHGLQPSARSAR